MDVFLLALQLDYCPLYDTRLSCPECPYFGLPHGGRPRPEESYQAGRPGLKKPASAGRRKPEKTSV